VTMNQTLLQQKQQEFLLAFAASRHKNALFRYSVKNIICENNIVRDMSVRMRLKYVGTHIANYSLY